jgi:hypothetical protein
MTSQLNFIKNMLHGSELFGMGSHTHRQNGRLISLPFLFKESKLRKKKEKAIKTEIIKSKPCHPIYAYYAVAQNNGSKCSNHTNLFFENQDAVGFPSSKTLTLSVSVTPGHSTNIRFSWKNAPIDIFTGFLAKDFSFAWEERC